MQTFDYYLFAWQKNDSSPEIVRKIFLSWQAIDFFWKDFVHIIKKKFTLNSQFSFTVKFPGLMS